MRAPAGRGRGGAPRGCARPRGTELPQARSRRCLGEPGGGHPAVSWGSLTPLQPGSAQTKRSRRAAPGCAPSRGRGEPTGAPRWHREGRGAAALRSPARVPRALGTALQPVLLRELRLPGTEQLAVRALSGCELTLSCQSSPPRCEAALAEIVWLWLKQTAAPV